MPEFGIYSADLHLHSFYSGGTSANMNIRTIAQQARMKGLAIVGTGDIFHPKWLEEVKKELHEVEDGTYVHPSYGTRFILSTEIEDARRVHHLIFLPSVSSVEGMREELSKRSANINSDGRSKVDLNAPEIVEITVENGGMIGPSHAFTPWTSLYKEFDSIKACYLDRARDIKFLELGLSADTYMADRIEELSDLTFLSNSDAHSPWPEKLGREFNRFYIAEPTYREIIKAIVREGGRKIVLNVGFDPRLGKYHRTACSRCYKQFELDRARELRWRCDRCLGMIKKGVWDRVNELATYAEPKSPPHRPPYLRIAPLSEIIALAIGEDPHSPEVGARWRKLVERFGDEIRVLVDAPQKEIEETAGEQVAMTIKAFRAQELRVIPGGGGCYGHLEIPNLKLKTKAQKTLIEFFKK